MVSCAFWGFEVVVEAWWKSDLPRGVAYNRRGVSWDREGLQGDQGDQGLKE